MRSPGDNQATVSLELSYRTSHLNFALFWAELVHSFHGKAFHQKTYVNLESRALGKPALLAELGNESIAHLPLVLFPPIHTLHLLHSFFNRNITSASYRRGSELDTRDSEVKAQALVLKELNRLVGEDKEIKLSYKYYDRDLHRILTAKIYVCPPRSIPLFFPSNRVLAECRASSVPPELPPGQLSMVM